MVKTDNKNSLGSKSSLEAVKSSQTREIRQQTALIGNVEENKILASHERVQQGAGSAIEAREKTESSLTKPEEANVTKKANALVSRDSKETNNITENRSTSKSRGRNRNREVS